MGNDMKKSKRWGWSVCPGKGWSICVGNRWSLCSENGGQFKLESGGQFHRFFHIGKILHAEMVNWLRFYQVSLNDFKNHRKDIAIAKGKELKFIQWDRLPQTIIQLQKVNNISDGVHEAKRVITHTINEIQKDYTIDSTETLIRFVEVITTEYNLYHHSIKQLGTAIKKNPSGKIELKSLMVRLKTSLFQNISA